MADSQPAILVTGATGNVGAPLVAMLAMRGVRVRAASRRPASEPASSLEHVPFDFTAEGTWDAAFEGVHAMFLVRPPQLGNARRDVLPALERAKALGVRHVVFLSIQGVDRLRVVPHARIEDWCRESGLSWTFLRASFFDQNLMSVHGRAVRERGELLIPAGRGRTAFIDANDVAAVAAQVMLDPGPHVGTAPTLTGSEALTYGEVAGIMTAVLGRSIRYVQPGLLPYLFRAGKELGLSAPLVATTAAIYTTARLGLAAGLTDHVERLLGRPPTTMAAFVARERASFEPMSSARG